MRDVTGLAQQLAIVLLQISIYLCALGINLCALGIDRHWYIVQFCAYTDIYCV